MKPSPNTSQGVETPYPSIMGEPVTRDRILIVEDDATIGLGLVRALESTGYDVELVRTGGEAVQRATTMPRLDLVLLDLGLPDIDGIEVCRSIRSIDDTLPIVMLTARQDEVDVVVSLDAGAVDYVTKPFRLAELLARLRVQLRRNVVQTSSTSPVVVGDLALDHQSRRVWLNDTELPLRVKEFDLLRVLVDNVGHVVTREHLMSEVWDEHWFGSTRTLDVHIAALRRRLGETVAEETGRETGKPSRITTLRAVGYRYDPQQVLS